MNIVVLILIGAFLLFLLSGGYVFYAACARRKEHSWMDKEALAKTPYGKYYDCILQADAWLKEHNAQDVFITSKDGLKLHGVWVPAENPRGTIILAHGYRSTKLVDFGVAFPYYHEHGFNVLSPDHRAHGQSQGRFITFGVKESDDILRWIRYHNQSFGEIPVFLSGLSMGASTVMFLADAQLPENVKGTIADCGFTSPKDIITCVFRNTVHFSPGPILVVSELFARLFAGFSLTEKDTRKALQNSKRPVLLIHGADDDYVPCSMTKESYAACNGPKELLLVEGAGHGVSFLVDHQRYCQVLEAFLERCLKNEEKDGI